jgi:hypothetical protein
MNGSRLLGGALTDLARLRRHNLKLAVGNLLEEYGTVDLELSSQRVETFNTLLALILAEIERGVFGFVGAFRFCVHASKYRGYGLYSQDFLYSNLLLAMSVQTGYTVCTDRTVERGLWLTP